MAGKATSGGSAMAGGQRYQAQVTAWWCAKILLQTRNVGSCYDLEDASIAEKADCEKPGEEDIGIELSNNGYIFGQCKRRLNLSNNPKKDWAKTLKQFYKDFETESNKSNQNRRYVVFYEKANRSLEKVDEILRRYRSSDISLIGAANSEEEKTLVRNLNGLLDSIETEHDFSQLKEKRHDFLRNIYLTQLKFDEQKQQNISESLQGSLLKDPNQAGIVLKLLHNLADDLIAERLSADRLLLRKKLKESGVALKDSINYRADSEKLRDLTNRQIEYNKHKGLLKIKDRECIISRYVTDIMFQIAKSRSFLVVGSPGTGKSGCLLELIKKLNDSGKRVIYWAAGDYKYSSIDEIGRNIQLQNSWENIFEDLSTGEGATLIIDGLDELRDSPALRAYQHLFELAINRDVKVIASIRSFDLQYSTEIKRLFYLSNKSTISDYSKDEFKNVSHILVPELDDKEFAQVTEHFTILNKILDTSPNLEPIIRNLFSLDLLSKIISESNNNLQFSSISTQAELFDKYWEQRINSNQLRNEITSVLTEIINKMVEEQKLCVVSPTMNTSIEDAILGTEIIRCPIQRPGRLPESGKIEFANNLLFDYAAERLFIRPRSGDLVKELSKLDGWGLFLRPSLVLHHRWAWHQGKEDFWERLIELERASIFYIQKLPGYLEMAEESRDRKDLQPLLDYRLGSDCERTHWTHIVQGVIGAAKFSALPRILEQGSGDWWIEFARDLILTKEKELVYAGQWLLATVSQHVNRLSSQSRLYFNQAAIRLVSDQWQEPLEMNRIKHSIGWVCTTAASDIQASSEVIRKLIDREEIKRSGYITGETLAHNLKYLYKADTKLAVEVYDAFFGYTESDQSPTPIHESRIFSLLSNRKQDYDFACHQLSEEFPEFLSEYPSEATNALIRVFRNFCNFSEDPLQKYYQRESPPIQTFYWVSKKCDILPYSGHIWDEDWVATQEYPTKMLHAWQTFLEELPDKNQHDLVWEKIADTLINENELASIWRRLLIASSRSPRFFSGRIWTMLLNPVILAGPDTNEAAKNCIKAFVIYLPDSSIHQIEETILIIQGDPYGLDNPKYFEPELILIKAELLRCIPEEKLNIEAKEFLSNCGPVLLHTRKQENIIESNDVKIGEPPENRLIKWIFAYLEELTEESITDYKLKDILRDLHDIEHVSIELKEQIDSSSYSEIRKRTIEGFAKVACSKASLDEPLRNDLYKRFRAILTIPSDNSSSQNLAIYDGDHVIPNLLFTEKAYATWGFCCLATKDEFLSSELKDLFMKIANDPDPSVRFHLGSNIWPLLNKWPEFVWDTLEHWISELPTRVDVLTVIHGTLNDSWFWWLRKDNQLRADQMLRNLWAAARLRDSRNLKRVCGEWLMALYLIKGESWAENAIESALNPLETYIFEMDGALNFAVRVLLPRKPINPIPEERQKRGIRFLTELLENAKKAICEYEEIAKSSSSKEAIQTPDSVKQLVKFFKHVSAEFQFSAEGYYKYYVETDATNKDEIMAEWWLTSESILKSLLIFPEPAVVFDLIKGLERLVDLDVNRVLRLLREATLASLSKGLSLENQAKDKTIKILGSILAEHKVSLVDIELRSDFVQILDAYMQVGWPEALEMGVQIESIYR